MIILARVGTINTNEERGLESIQSQNQELINHVTPPMLKVKKGFGFDINVIFASQKPMQNVPKRGVILMATTIEHEKMNTINKTKKDYLKDSEIEE